MDTATARRGYSDDQAWIQRRLGVDTGTACRGTFLRQISGRRYCDEKVATAKKHLDVAISTLIRGYCHVFSVAKLITCTSVSMERMLV